MFMVTLTDQTYCFAGLLASLEAGAVEPESGTIFKGVKTGTGVATAGLGADLVVVVALVVLTGAGAGILIR